MWQPFISFEHSLQEGMAYKVIRDVDEEVSYELVGFADDLDKQKPLGGPPATATKILQFMFRQVTGSQAMPVAFYAYRSGQASFALLHALSSPA